MFWYFLGGLLLGAGVATLVLTVTYYAAKWLTKSNIFAVLKDALRSSQEEAAKKALSRAFKAAVKSKSINTVTISVLMEEVQEEINVTIHGDGVSEDIRESMPICA